MPSIFHSVARNISWSKIHLTWLPRVQLSFSNENSYFIGYSFSVSISNYLHFKVTNTKKLKVNVKTYVALYFKNMQRIWVFYCLQFNYSDQFSSVTQSCPSLCDPVECSTPGLPVHYQLLELAEMHVHRVRDAIQSSHPLSSPTPLSSIFPSIWLFSIESVLRIRWPKYWSFSFSFSISPSNEYLGLISFRMYWLDLLAVWGLSRVFSNTTVQKQFCKYQQRNFPFTISSQSRKFQDSG